jgi:hypothetical protein
MVEGKTVMEVQTVIVDRPVTVTEKVVETVRRSSRPSSSKRQ